MQTNKIIQKQTHKLIKKQTHKFIKRFQKRPLITSKAVLIAMTMEGEVYLAKNECGIYELPVVCPERKVMLEDALRMTLNKDHSMNVGALSVLHDESSVELLAFMEDGREVYRMNTVYYTEDFIPEKHHEFFKVEQLPLLIEPQSARLIETYYRNVQSLFMQYIYQEGTFI